MNHYFIIFIIAISSILISQNSEMNLLQQIEENAKKITKNQNKVYKQAKALERGGMVDEAISLYKEILNNNPFNQSAFRSLKNILKKEQEWELLIELAKKHTKDNPDLSSKIELIEVYLWSGKYKIAYNLSDEIIKTDLLDINGKKKLISKLLYNKHLEHGIKMISFIRENDDRSFYSLELGAHYSMQMDFTNSLKEYLMHINYNKKNFDLVVSRLMTFPDDVELKEKIKLILLSTNEDESLEILSNFEFKWENYEDSYNTLLKSNTEPMKMYQFGKDLVAVEEFELAEHVFENLLKVNNQDIIENSIYQIGSIFEKKTINKESFLPISNRFFNSIFFWSDYLKVDDKSGETMFKAISMYDSLSTKFNHSHAKYRLADIKYRAFGDLDNALKQFMELEKKDKQHEIRFASAIKTLDIMIAQGDLENAKKTVKLLREKYHRKSDRLNLRIKELQISFYIGEYDYVNEEIEQIIKTIDKDHWAYNDILDIYSIILTFNKDVEGLKLFSSSLCKIKQNKKQEAIEIFKSMFNHENIFISDLAKYNCAYLYKEFNEFEKIIDIIKMTSSETIYSEMSIILHAEIYDYIINDDNEAITQYLELLEKYPLSIYYEEIRTRLREIVG